MFVYVYKYLFVKIIMVYERINELTTYKYNRRACLYEWNEHNYDMYAIMILYVYALCYLLELAV